MSEQKILWVKVEDATDEDLEHVRNELQNAELDDYEALISGERLDIPTKKEIREMLLEDGDE
ncbi:hypothetical protein SAMN05421858_5084 [Haladaptatus litoreus]|uniref:Uncharacterized protein n=1 Tax=Haladaptatus litoreus TaxID=553468 RepID=A0A1N7FIB6_9EURY|nr:hypothetical protein [Haladaptatus litoreus]SIR99976.1 hypothetical protein SAMN05421858_5084 [Haladaptatus litoreus]